MHTMLEKYNRLTEDYHKNRHAFDLSTIFNDFYESIGQPKSGLVLDLGCGAGDGFPEYFMSKGLSIEGIDFSPKMVSLCQEYHPEIKIHQADLTTVNIEKNRYEVIESIYAFFHISTIHQYELLQKCYEGLKTDGFMFFTYATQEYTGKETFEGFVDFMGTPLFYAHKTPQILVSDMREIGFKNIQMSKKEVGGEKFLWVSGQK